MKKYWDQHGLVEAGAKKAEFALPVMLTAVELCGDRELAELVFKEAIFQAYALPKRTMTFQRMYLNGEVNE